MSTGYGYEGIRQVCAMLLGARHVSERLCGGPCLQRGAITSVRPLPFTFTGFREILHSLNLLWQKTDTDLAGLTAPVWVAQQCGHWVAVSKSVSNVNRMRLWRHYWQSSNHGWSRLCRIATMTFLGHVTSSTTWSFNVHHVIFYGYSIDTNSLYWAVCQTLSLKHNGSWPWLSAPCDVIGHVTILLAICWEAPRWRICTKFFHRGHLTINSDKHFSNHLRGFDSAGSNFGILDWLRQWSLIECCATASMWHKQ